MLTINKKIGANTVQVVIDEKKPKDELAKMCFWLTPDYCFLCKGQNIVFEANNAKTADGTFTYIKRKCINPECIQKNGGTCATSTMGEYKDGGFFWKQWEVFKGKSQVDEDDMGYGDM
jgi:hypothetical protein